MRGLRGQAYSLAYGLLCCGCGAGLPQLQPAHVLKPGSVEVSAGVSSEISSSSRPKREGKTPEQLALDAVKHALRGAGIAPWVQGRVGLSGQNEASLAYSGRHLRLGARHGFQDGKWALSVGGGFSSVLIRERNESAEASQRSESQPNWKATGWGADLPIALGWQSRAEVVALWLGLRAGFEHLRGEVRSRESMLGATEAHGSRWNGGGFLGFSVGVHPIRVRAELTAVYVSGTADVEPPEGPAQRLRVDGLALSPAGSIAVQF